MSDRPANGSELPAVGWGARPEWAVIKTFALLILAGAALLALPAAHPDGRWMNPVSALFTSTSATCVTGLVLVDTGSGFSLFGQVVILALIQAGGIGLMTLATFLLLIVGKRMAMSDESLMMRTLGLGRAAGLGMVLRKTVWYTVLFEGTGAVILAWRFATTHGMSPVRAIYEGVFHSVSAFCNAGFALRPDSLTAFRHDPWVVLTMAGLIVSGGLGFLVWHELTAIKFWRIRTLRGRLSLHTRLVLVSTAVLVVVGALGFLLLEWGETLAPLTVAQRWWTALFHGVTPRTAGFNLVEMGDVTPATLFLNIALMFVGGAPCSTAGGIKVMTLVVMVLTVNRMLRGRREVSFANRTLPETAVREGLAIFTLGLAQVAVVFGLLLLTEAPGLAPGRFGAADALLFETVSAFGTVGLSTGVTPHLTVWGRLALIVMMFAGRLGPVTIASFIGGREMRQRIRYPEEHVVLG